MGEARSEIPVEALNVSAYRIPTDAPEDDGTLALDSTVMVLVEVSGDGNIGLGYTYAAAAAAHLIREELRPVVIGQDCFAIPRIWNAMIRRLRNIGVTGLASMAVSAVDIALWDLKANLLRRPLAALLGQVRPSIPVYGSGGFTSYDEKALQAQLGNWARQGIGAVKMKVGTTPAEDPARVRAARKAIGQADLFVDANGAYTRKRALALAAEFAEAGVTWFEEPLPVQDVEGNRWVRDRVPAGMEVTGGEYGFAAIDFRRLIEGGAVDVLQADATRSLGVTGFLEAAALCESHNFPMSSHCAPSLHLPLGCAIKPMRNIEFFHDHVRIERMFFDGFREPVEGRVAPDPERYGLGLSFKKADAERYRLA